MPKKPNCCLEPLLNHCLVPLQNYLGFLYKCWEIKYSAFQGLCHPATLEYALYVTLPGEKKNGKKEDQTSILQIRQAIYILLFKKPFVLAL